MKDDLDDWAYVLNTVEALFYRLALGVGVRTNISLADCHEQL